MKCIATKCIKPRLALYTAALFILTAGLVFYFTGHASAKPDGNVKVTICHIPPDDPSNFHTITVNQNALSSHLMNHGDLEGACGTFCEDLCDDDDACTTDFCDESEQCAHESVDCTDGNVCTEDEMCDFEYGCLNELLVGLECDDSSVCTGGDECDQIDGVPMCAGIPIPGCCSVDDQCEEYPYDDLCTINTCVSNSCVSEPVLCESVNPCFVGACVNGDCSFSPRDCDDSDPCTADSCESCKLNAICIRTISRILT